MEKKINFILPGMYEHFKLNMNLIQLMIEHPEMFYPNVQIGAVYGNFQFCIFDGGRIFEEYRHTTREEMEFIVSEYNSHNIPVRLIFTNPIVPETSFKNRFGQATLEVCHNNINEIVVNNKELENYIRENYPNFSFISSTTKCLNTPQAFKEELNNPNYKMICLDYNLNHNQKLLNEIPQEDRSRCEFLINAICPPGCPNRKQHYKLNGLFSLNYGKRYAIAGCPIKYNTLDPRMFQNTNNLTPEEVFEYAEKGYINFKLEGRTLGIIENACNYVKYLIKPEYQFLAISILTAEDPAPKIFTNYTTSTVSY